MYKFTERNIPEFLIGSELLQSCVGNNEIILRFSDKKSITVLSIDSFYKYNIDFLSSIIQFDGKYIGRSVEGVALVGPEEIVINLSGSTMLRVIDDSLEYESAIFKSEEHTYPV